MRTAHLLTVLVVLTVLASPAVGGDDGHPGHRHLGEVAGGSVGVLDDAAPAVFWETPFIACDGDPSMTSPSAPPTCDDEARYHWTFEVDGTAEMLRVDVDHPYRQDTFVLRVATPGGRVHSHASQNTYSGGIEIASPAPGTYTVGLAAERTAGSVARLRAGLLAATPTTEGALLPNLRVTPPFEFGFAAPINPANSTFVAGDDQNPGVVVADEPLHSCTADEVQEAADPTQNPQPTALVRCLRFTAGPDNVGAGHFDLRFPILHRAQHDTDRLVEMTQVIHHTDGTATERPAGTYEYHATHGHYHYTDVLFYELLAYDAEAGTLVDAGVGHKSGFCPVDQGYGDWGSFAQDDRAAVAQEQTGDCLALGGDGAMGLTAGWGDVYRWQRPGQFVDFTLQPDGEYVVRATVDVREQVLESDETDNASYAWIRVTGDDVEILERGYGQSPLDPDKVVAADHRGQYPTPGLDAHVVGRR